MKSQPNPPVVSDRAPSVAAKRLALPLAAVLLAAAAVLPGAAPAAQAASSMHADDAWQLQSAIVPKTLSLKINGTAMSVPGAESRDGKTTYIALRFLSEKLELSVSWDQPKQASTVTGRNVTIVTKATDPQPYTINGQRLFGIEPVVQNGVTYIPIRFFLEAFGYAVDYNGKTQGITVTPLPINALTIAAKTLDESNGTQDFVVQYPQITGFADQAVQDKVNRTIQTKVNAIAAEARQELKAAEFEQAHIKKGYTVNYVVANNSNGKLSLYLESYLYTGGAHGRPARVPLTFDLSTGDTLTLQQAVGGHPNYKAIVNKIVKEGFAKGNYVLGPNYETEPFESISDDQPYFLRNHAAVVYFVPYQYTPYVAGFPEFSIPLSQFK